MGRYTAIPQNAFDALQLDAGILLKHFDITEAAAGRLGFTDADIICATTGGIKPSCIATFSDFASDVDNAPNNVKEFKHLDGWDCKIATTGLGTSPELIRLALGAADVSGNKVTPRRDLKQSDFSDLWWVGDRADGGCVAIKLINALSTSGFSLTTTKNGKGQVAIEFTGHVSLTNQDKIPMEFYSIDPSGTVTPDIVLNKSNVSVAVEGTVSVVATTTPSGQTVTWTSDDTDKATVEDGVITGVAAGSATITASMTYNNVTYTDTCEVTVTAGA